ncbi:Ig-like domain-containing protein [Peribacillus glennii]|nr:Ig-like domain-containing protein [Peribacillus glennii]
MDNLYYKIQGSFLFLDTVHTLFHLGEIHMRRFRQWLSIILVLALCFSFAPASLAAENTEIPVYAKLSGHTSWVRTTSISSDGTLLASGGMDGAVRVWDTTTLKELMVRVLSSDIRIVEMSPSGRYVAVCTNNYDDPIYLWDIQTNSISELQGHEYSANVLAFTPDEKQLISGGSDEKVIVWDLAAAAKTQEFTYADDVTSLSVLASKQFVAAGLRNNTIQVRNYKTGQQVKTISGVVQGGSYSYPVDLTFTPDGESLYVAGSTSYPNVFQVDNGFSRVPNDPSKFGETSYWKKVQFSQDGSFLFTNDGYSAYVYDTLTGELLAKSDSTYIQDMEVDPSLKFIAAAGHEDVEMMDLSDAAKTITSLTIQVDDTSIPLNREGSVKVIANYSNNTKKILKSSDVKWTTSDFQTAVVNGDTIIPRKEGKVTLTAAYKKIEASLDVEVTQPVKELTHMAFSSKQITMNEKGQAKISIYGFYDDGSKEHFPLDDFTFTAADPRMVSIQGNYIVGIRAGKTRLTAKTKNYTFSTTVVVKDITPPAAPKVKAIANTSRIITGKAEAGSTIVVVAGKKTYKTVAKTSGSFSVSVPPQKAGAAITVTAIDKSGNKSKSTKIVVSKKK